jgi:hypothetical protein
MAVDSNLDFQDFSVAYDEVQVARKALEAFGTARLADPLPIEITAAQQAFVEAATRYKVIVDALINPKIS